jgi:cell division protease FtsH
VYYAPKKQSQFLAAMSEATGNYSAETANLLDEEVRKIIDTQYGVALRILKEQRALLESWAEKLLEDEVIEGETLDDLMAAVAADNQSKKLSRPASAA